MTATTTTTLIGCEGVDWDAQDHHIARCEQMGITNELTPCDFCENKGTHRCTADDHNEA